MISVAGMALVPGNQGKDCPGNGEGKLCYCDECDYLICCLDSGFPKICQGCTDTRCPRSGKGKN